MGYKITVGGVDITPYVQEYGGTLKVEEALDQRTAICGFDVYGNGCASIVGMKEVICYDQNGSKFYGGYVSQIDDTSFAKVKRVHVTCYDYTQHLARRMTNEIWVEVGDVYILKQMLTKYAPWVGQGSLPTTNVTIIPRITYNRTDLLTSIRRLSDATGWVFWVDANKNARYENPSNATPAPFSISDYPDDITSVAARITKFDLDYTNLTNRVFVLGGTTLSNDYTQQMGIQADGTNAVFYFHYKPTGSTLTNAHGKHLIQVSVNGVSQVVGSENINNLKPQDIYDCLVNYNEKLLRFATAPPKGATVTVIYRYQIPILLAIQSQQSYNQFGDWYDAKISDNRISDAAIAHLRGQTIINQFAFGETTGTLDDIRKQGLHAGQALTIVNRLRGINATYLIQKLTTSTKGNGDICYSVEFGAFNRSLVDQFNKINLAINPDDTSAISTEDSSEDSATAQLVTVSETGVTTTFIDRVTFNQLTSGHYYPGSGNGSYPGFSVPTGHT